MHVDVVVTRGVLGRFFCLFFFFNDTATTEIYTLSLHDALPICRCRRNCRQKRSPESRFMRAKLRRASVLSLDRKSTRLNSSHSQISYAVFCLKKKKEIFTGPYFCAEQSPRCHGIM